MLKKRLVACLDVRDGKLAKSIKFVDTKDIGDPVAKAREYYEDGVDELVFYDITASSNKHRIMLNFVEAVAREVFIPLSVGGGVASVHDAIDLHRAGADKINVNSQAVQRPELISECATMIGSQSTVLSMDIKRVAATKSIPSGYEIVINGGRLATGIDALQWAIKGVALGAGELVINAMDADGTKAGYDIEMTRTIAEQVPIPVIASGGAGKPEHLSAVLTTGKADAALVASIVHYGNYTCSSLKAFLHSQNINIRLNW